MAKKTSAEQTPESKPVKKAPVRKTSKSTEKKAATSKKTEATSAAIASMSSAPPVSDTLKTEKKQTARPRGKSSTNEDKKPRQDKSETTAPREEKTQQPVIQVRRESFRPKAQENRHHDSEPNEGFSQPETVGGETPGGNSRNKRRNRNRNRRQNEERQEDLRIHDGTPGGSRKLDLGKLSKKAWKIFLSEVTEEGLALMDDNTSREAAKRAFRVAEFFMHEEARRKHPHDQQQRPARQNQQPAEQSPEKTETAEQTSPEES